MSKQFKKSCDVIKVTFQTNGILTSILIEGLQVFLSTIFQTVSLIPFIASDKLYFVIYEHVVFDGNHFLCKRSKRVVHVLREIIFPLYESTHPFMSKYLMSYVL